MAIDIYACGVNATIRLMIMAVKSLGTSRLIPVLSFLIVTITMSMWLPLQLTCQAADEKIWYVHDTIQPALDEVSWVEEGGIQEAASWITDGSWHQASMRQSLVGPNDIFVETYETFNWSLVRPIAEYYYSKVFATFDVFTQSLRDDPSQWLYLSWQIDASWYGVSSNTTKIRYSFNETTSDVELWTWFHITRIPEYIVGEGRLESWLTGFDLTPVSIGSLKLWEFHEDWNQNGISYNLRFKAPANVLSQHGENFTFTIGVSSYYQGLTFGIQQVIDVNMPAITEVKEMSPLNMSVFRGNTASFVIAKGDIYPNSFTVVSGPPTKPLSQIVWENASIWLVTPGGWAAIATLLVLGFTGLRGRRIWRRNRLYHRMYNSMVTIYQLYSSDLIKFHQEMANVSSSIFQLVVQDRITDEQFERLLVRRDDLLQRAHQEQARTNK